ncbi:hypothetical protein KC343_g11384, partial [Hortaea werneckii]
MDDPELEVEGNDQLRQFLGTESFGKQTREANVQKQVDLSKRTDADASGEGAQNGKADRHQDDSDDEDDHDDDDDDDDDDDEDDEYPTSHEMVMKTHERAVTAVTLDPSGARLVSGGMDCTLKFHDFASMTPTTIRAFKSVDPTATKSSANVETHPVHQALFNP